MAFSGFLEEIKPVPSRIPALEQGDFGINDLFCGVYILRSGFPGLCEPPSQARIVSRLSYASTTLSCRSSSAALPHLFVYTGCAETLFMDYKRQNGVDIRIMRIFNTYGPRMNADDGRVISNFIVQALRGEEITIYGDGSQTRSFCYCDDNIEGMIRLMDGDHPGPINIGNPNEFTMLELAEQIIDLTGSSSKISHFSLPKDDPKQRQPDISLAKAELDWEPKTELREGLTSTIAYFEKELSEK